MAQYVTTCRRSAATVLPCRHLNTGEAAAAATNQALKSLYVVNVEGKRHNGPLLLGLMEYFERHLSRVVRSAELSHRAVKASVFPKRCRLRMSSTSYTEHWAVSCNAASCFGLLCEQVVL